LNLDTQGTGRRDGDLLPTEYQTHVTLEPTFGLSEDLALGFMFLNAWEPGYSPQFAVDREFSRWQIAFNPVFERALHGPGTAHSWNFKPAALIRWKRRRFSPSVEYYGEIESITVRPHAHPEVHQLFLGGDWKLGPVFSLNSETGFDLAGRGPGVVLKSRLEWDWRRGTR